MKLYKMTTKSWGPNNPSYEYTVYIEDGYVVRTEPTCRYILGMKEETFLNSESTFGSKVERIESKMETYLVQYMQYGFFKYAHIEAANEREALRKFTEGPISPAPLSVWKCVGKAELVTIPTYKLVP